MQNFETMKFLKLAPLALGALPAPIVFAQDFERFSPLGSDATKPNSGPKPNILWSVDLRDVGMDSGNSQGTGIAITNFSKFSLLLRIAVLSSWTAPMPTVKIRP
jgi:hypothetical protein